MAASRLTKSTATLPTNIRGHGGPSGFIGPYRPPCSARPFHPAELGALTTPESVLRHIHETADPRIIFFSFPFAVSEACFSTIKPLLTVSSGRALKTVVCEFPVQSPGAARV